jgi:tetratricopeptide (TPR) repeat protein
MDLSSIFEQVSAGDPVGAAYRFTQLAGPDATGDTFYEAGSLALGQRDELGDDALRFARLVFEEAVERDPSRGEAHHDLATTMRELGMAEDAIVHYRRALELMPKDPDSLIGLGAALCDAGKLDEAVTSLEQASEAYPDNGRAYANLGVALEAAGRDAEAASAYAKALARFEASLVDAPDDETATEVAARRRWARVQHATLLERMECWPQAIVEYRRLYEEEQAIAEAEEQAAAEADPEHTDDEGHESEHGKDADKPAEASPEAKEQVLEEALTSLKEGGAGETIHDEEPPSDAPDGDGAEAGDEDDEELETGRIGLERLFVRFVKLGRHDLAYLVLDDLGGELSDAGTRSTYAIYDPGDGLATIMVESWDGGERQRLDPARK